MCRYRCLVLDHDDTVVRSTPDINYPSFLRTLAAIRPGVHLTLQEFMGYSFDPGFHALCRDILDFSEAEMDYEYSHWKDYVRLHAPAFYEGMASVVERQKAEGGYVCVVSHSCDENIRRDYGLHCRVQPDLVFGWDLGVERCKPSPWPLQEIMRELCVLPSDILVVDDLKPGLKMAEACGADFGWAGWSCVDPKNLGYMRANGNYYFETVGQLGTLLFPDSFNKEKDPA